LQCRLGFGSQTPAGQVSFASISLTHDGLATATYPDDFYHSTDVDPEPIRDRPLDVGTYTMLTETPEGAQLACSGAFVRPASSGSKTRGVGTLTSR
jgi:hypothetical protein